MHDPVFMGEDRQSVPPTKRLCRLSVPSRPKTEVRVSMQLLTGFQQHAPFRGGCVSIGNFDGVHLGHVSMLRSLRRLATSRSVPAVVFTFDPHPVDLLRPDQAPPKLITRQRKLELFAQQGIDACLVYATDTALLQLSADEFFEQIILCELQATGLVEGPNFYFGRGRGGDTNRLRELCTKHGLLLDVVPPFQLGDQMVSSTAIRKLIQAGEITAANQMLGHLFQITGNVVTGAQRGRTIGFPTANLSGFESLLPAAGVYAGRCRVNDATFPAAINVGGNPTFDEPEPKIEVHLIGFSGDLYGRMLSVDLVDRIRDTRRFESVTDLQRQLTADVAAAATLANTPSPR